MAMGLRERRKLETRQAVSGVAMQLFEANGFENVTITQVAETAGVSKMTVTNYFPRKEDLVFDRAEEIIQGLADAVATRAQGESVLTAVRRNFADHVEAQDAVPTPAFARMVHESHTLTARTREIADLRERALGDVIAAEFGRDDPQHRVAAALLASVHRVLFVEGFRRVLEGRPREEVVRLLEREAREAFDRLQPSLGDFCVKARRPHAAETVGTDESAETDGRTEQP